MTNNQPDPTKPEADSTHEQKGEEINPEPQPDPESEVESDDIPF